MYRIIIRPTTATQDIALSFKTESLAQAIDEKIYQARRANDGAGAAEMLVLKDEFGHILRIYAHSIFSTIYIDVDKDTTLQIEQSYLNKKAQHSLDNKISSDPVLRTNLASAPSFQV